MNIRECYKELSASLMTMIENCGHLTDWEVRQVLLGRMGEYCNFYALSRFKREKLKPFLDEFEKYFSKLPRIKSKKVNSFAAFEKDMRLPVVKRIYATTTKGLVEGAFLWSNYEHLYQLWNKADRDIATIITFALVFGTGYSDELNTLKNTLKNAEKLNGIITGMLENRSKYLE
ncbi:MAG: hypothetical protein NWE95_01770 [Candidatus Bathyarchaeota archaeon]|nr:hypothetical protein [Candidatus Bathyarchaeota archaeon]